MNTFVVLKVYRQKDGEYVAVETETVLKTKEAVDKFLEGKPRSWWETKAVPLFDGTTAQIEFAVVRGVHETVLQD
jgi:hypothetical protein